jgi:hypothetical protein
MTADLTIVLTTLNTGVGGEEFSDYVANAET